MNNYLYSIVILLFSIFLYSSCANQQRPDGGPKDTIPPTFISSLPYKSAVNVNTTTFYFEFDERINTDKLKKELIIVPSYDGKYKINIKKTSFSLIFEEPFDSATTYTFNFADGVTDVTEKNPVENFSYVFSTGSQLDSLSISGSVTTLENNKPVEKAIVILQQAADSISPFTNKPYYFTYTDDKGQYKLENLKNGKYQLYSFIDTDKNLTANAEKESIAFLKDTLDLMDDMDSVDLTIVAQNNKKLKYIRSGIKGNIFQITYNKPLSSYTILNTNERMPIAQLSPTRESVIFYNTSDINDSLLVIIEALDTIGDSSMDSVQIKFDSDSDRQPFAFETNFNQVEDKPALDTFNLAITFNKPITSIQYDSIRLKFDTLYEKSIDPNQIDSDSSKMKYTIQLPIPLDTIKRVIEATKSSYAIDTLITKEDTIKRKKYILIDRLDPKQISFVMSKGAFMSVQMDSSEYIEKTLKINKLEDFGSISGSISTDTTNFILQLINTKYLIIRELNNIDTFSFKGLKPGDYQFRVIIDKNGNGTWDKGNIYKRIPPEKSIIVSEVLSLRANWELNDVDISF